MNPSASCHSHPSRTWTSAFAARFVVVAAGAGHIAGAGGDIARDSAAAVAVGAAIRTRLDQDSHPCPRP